jgi:hypothetical protein
MSKKLTCLFFAFSLIYSCSHHSKVERKLASVNFVGSEVIGDYVGRRFVIQNCSYKKIGAGPSSSYGNPEKEMLALNGKEIVFEDMGAGKYLNMGFIGIGNLHGAFLAAQIRRAPVLLKAGLTWYPEKSELHNNTSAAYSRVKDKTVFFFDKGNLKITTTSLEKKNGEESSCEFLRLK